MKKRVQTAVLVFILSAAYSQQQITTIIQKGWPIYPQQQPEDSITIPSKINFNKNIFFTLNAVDKEEGEGVIKFTVTLLI